MVDHDDPVDAGVVGGAGEVDEPVPFVGREERAVVRQANSEGGAGHERMIALRCRRPPCTSESSSASHGSRPRRPPLRQAIDLAKKLGAELHLVTAFSGSDREPVGRGPKARRGIPRVDRVVVGRPIQTHALPGDPAAAILRVAGEVDADLIVVGNKGMHGASRILGSVPNSIAHKTNCSILIVSTT